MLFAVAIPLLAQDAGWIGVSIEDQKDRGAVVRRVEPNSPAGKAGVKEDDVIVEFNSERVIGVQQLTRLVRETPVGRTVDLKILRSGREELLQVTTERTPRLRSGKFEFEIPDVRVFADRIARDLPKVQVNTVFVQAGIRVEQMTDQLRDFFGVHSDNGVLVTSVESGSAANKAGLKAGDVIIAVDGKNVRTPSDFSREIRPDTKPLLRIIRDRQEREIRID
jgi:serine protease Do